MGGGKAIRRRQKLAEKSNQGNLHKAARRKGGASAHLPLPGAPTQKDYQEKIPASLRKMLALKEIAQQPSKRPKLVETTAQQPPQRPQQQPAQPAAARGTDDQQGSPGAQLAAKQQPQQQRQQQQEPPQPSKKGALIWEQPKKLKARKKAYLNAKKLKKKARASGRRDPDDALAAAAAAAAQPAFGEVVHAPPEVQLKRKHWDAAAADKAAQQQQQQQQQQQKHKHKHKHKHKPTTQQSSELGELRDLAIAGYRAGRPAAREGHATLQSLKALVTK